VVVALTHAVVDPAKRKPFDVHTANVVRSMDSHEGLVGFSVRKQLFGNEAWTMTVWRDAAALEAFTRSPVHVAAIRAGAPALVEARFHTLTWPDAKKPPSWRQAKRILESVDPIRYEPRKDPA